MPVTDYTIPAPLMQAIVSTIGALPWQQVHQIMGALVSEIRHGRSCAVDSHECWHIQCQHRILLPGWLR